MKKGRIVFISILYIVFTTFIASYSWLLVKYCDGTFENDIFLHINEVCDGNWYSLAHVLIKLCYFTAAPKLLLVILLALIVGTTCIAIALLIKVMLRISGTDISTEFGLFIGITGIFLAQLYIPVFFPHYYVHETVLTQPWHNTTFMVMKLFAYLTLALYFYIYKSYESKVKLVYYILFIIALTITNFSKPNFLLGFAPAMLIFLIIDFIRARAKNILSVIKFGMCVIFSLPIVAYQASLVYDDGSSIIISFEEFVSLVKSPEYLLILAANLLFPFVITIVLIVAYKRKKDSLYVRLNSLFQAWTMFFISYAEKLFMLETGERAHHGNYAWGVYFFTGLLFIVSLVELIKAKKLNVIKSRIVYVISLVIYLPFVISGIAYYVCHILTGVYWV